MDTKVILATELNSTGLLLLLVNSKESLHIWGSIWRILCMQKLHHACIDHPSRINVLLPQQQLPQLLPLLCASLPSMKVPAIITLRYIILLLCVVLCQDPQKGKQHWPKKARKWSFSCYVNDVLFRPCGFAHFSDTSLLI